MTGSIHAVGSCFWIGLDQAGRLYRYERAPTIVFEARTLISYNSKFVYRLGRVIGWLEQIKANSDTASF
jgi:hypothetical protein